MLASETFWYRLKITPPVLVRLLARVRHGRPLTTVEISERSGLSPGLIEFLSEHRDWSGIDLPTFKAFMIGCDIDLLDRVAWRRIENYRAGTKVNGKRFGPTFRYLKRDPSWATYYQKLLASWLKNKGKP